jgi:DNA-binding NarL/FixJ family response regulator
VSARGYVIKSDAGSELAQALEAVIANGQFVGRRFLGLERLDLNDTGP